MRAKFEKNYVSFIVAILQENVQAKKEFKKQRADSFLAVK